MITDFLPAVNQRTLVNPNRIPRELWQYHQFVCWRYEPNPDPTKDPLKKPVNPRTLGNAGSTWSNTWSNIRTAVRVYQNHPTLAGIGFVLTPGDPYVMIDLDDCLTDGQLTPLAETILSRLDTYAEISPSGQGLRLFVRCDEPVTTKRPGVEVYSWGRFATLTGNVFQDRPIIHVPDLNWLVPPKPQTTQQQHNRTTIPEDDTDLWRRICAANRLAAALYQGDTSGVWSGGGDKTGPDNSRAVALLINSLKRWTGGDRQRIARMMKQTALDQSRWDDRRGGQTWLEMNINKIVGVWL